MASLAQWCQSSLQYCLLATAYRYVRWDSNPRLPACKAGAFAARRLTYSLAGSRTLISSLGNSTASFTETAGVAGIEPALCGLTVRCLATWPYSIDLASPTEESNPDPLITKQPFYAVELVGQEERQARCLILRECLIPTPQWSGWDLNPHSHRLRA